MGKALGFPLAFFIAFAFGYGAASLSFVYSDTYVLKTPLPISSGKSEPGLLPVGAELHYQSSAHGHTDFYVFVRVPRDQAIAHTEKTEVDAENGIARLSGDFN